MTVAVLQMQSWEKHHKYPKDLRSTHETLPYIAPRPILEAFTGLEGTGFHLDAYMNNAKSKLLPRSKFGCW